MSWTSELQDGAPYGAYVSWSKDGNPSFEARIKRFEGALEEAVEFAKEVKELMVPLLDGQLDKEETRKLQKLLKGVS
jgi:hypothetical protein